MNDCEGNSLEGEGAECDAGEMNCFHMVVALTFVTSLSRRARSLLEKCLAFSLTQAVGLSREKSAQGTEDEHQQEEVK